MWVESTHGLIIDLFGGMNKSKSSLPRTSVNLFKSYSRMFMSINFAFVYMFLIATSDYFLCIISRVK